ncbi:MAG: hypothetical protein H6727_00115 [Myxococcales bacterium]|nr:hypothetical protein [Myxococcales bacterium]
MSKKVDLRRLFLGLLFSFCVTVQWGCPSGAQLRGPRTTPKGKVQINVAPNALGIAVSANTGTSSATGFTGPFPVVDAALSYGITDFMDLQIQLNTFAYVTAGMGFQLLRSKFFDLSTSFDIGGTFFGLPGVSFGYLTFPLKILGGINLHERFSINVSAGYQGFFFFANAASTGASLLAHTITTSVGFDIRITDSFTLRPQGSVLIPLVNAGFVEGLIWNAGLGLVFTLGGAGPRTSQRRFDDGVDR